MTKENLSFWSSTFEDAYNEMDEIRGRWNGDNVGRAEDNASIALEIQEKLLEIQELIKELI